MYAKVFRSLWDGTLGPDWQAWSVFVFLLAHSDLEGFVDMTPQAISGRSGIPLEDVLRGLARLEAPDPNSRSQELEGRRLERIDSHRTWGWRIVNYGHYRSLRDEETVRAQTRARVQRHRQSLVTPGNATVTGSNAPKRHAEVEVEVEVEAEAPATDSTSPTRGKSKSRVPRFEKPTLAEVEAYFAEIQKPAYEAQRFMNHYDGNGWRTGKNPVKDWRACARNWQCGPFNPNGKVNGRKMSGADVLAFEAAHIKPEVVS